MSTATLPNTKKGTGYLAGIKEGQTVIHQDGDKGGVIIGERHSNGGVAAVNQSSGQHVEVEKNEVSIASGAVNSGKIFEFDGKKMTGREILSKINSDAGGVNFKKGGQMERKYSFNGKHLTDKQIEDLILTDDEVIDQRNGDKVTYSGGEVIITRPAVSDTTKRSFEGKMLTNLEILSIINQHGGGVALTEDTELKIPTTGREYEYGGKMVRDYDIVQDCGCKDSKKEDGGPVAESAELSPYAQSIYDDAVRRYNEYGNEVTESNLRKKQELISRAKKNVEYIRAQAAHRNRSDGGYDEAFDFIDAGEKFIRDYDSRSARAHLMAGGGAMSSQSISIEKLKYFIENKEPYIGREAGTEVDENNGVEYIRFSARISPNISSGKDYDNMVDRVISLMNDVKTLAGDAYKVEYSYNDEWVGFSVMQTKATGNSQVMAQGGMAISSDIDMEGFNLLNERVVNGQIIIDEESADKTYEWHSADNRLRVKSYDVPVGDNVVKQEYMVFIDDIPQRCNYNKALLLTKNYFDELYANAGYYQDGAVVDQKVIIESPVEPVQIVPVSISLGSDADGQAIKACIEQNRQIATQVQNSKWNNLRKLTFINDRIDEIRKAGSIADSEEVSMMYSELDYLWKSAKSFVRMR
jgi:hypothetical protein